MIKNCPVINISPQLPKTVGRPVAVDVKVESPENLAPKRKLQTPLES